jgi:hypothetical protein
MLPTADAALDEIPSEFICPISLSVMKSPVMSRDGKNFERTAILDWLNRGNLNCPLTRQPLKASLLAPNVNLKRSIKRWKKGRGQLVSGNDDDSLSSRESDVGFVGLLQVDQDDGGIQQGSNTAVERQAAESLRLQETRRRVDEELGYLLDLYNEVLELTSAPLDTVPSPVQHTSPIGSHGPLSQ